jgi:hypothetical protein
MDEYNEKIIVKFTRCWGQKRYYPVNELANLLLDFIDPRPKTERRKKSFTEEQIKIGRMLGMFIEVIAGEGK